MKDWLDDYYNRYKMSLFQTNVYDKLIQLKNLCVSVKENKVKLFYAAMEQAQLLQVMLQLISQNRLKFLQFVFQMQG